MIKIIADFFILLSVLKTTVDAFSLNDPIVSSISRDGYGRNEPNTLLNGFFPAWAIILLCLAGKL
jgi:hypothetical protein